MLRLLKKSLLLLLVLAGMDQARAFSLLGPYAADSGGGVWQIFTIGYNLPGDIGGPMNLGEEYRWNAPSVTYAFDESFLNYFGTNGVVAVEQAIKILNNVPAASALSAGLSEYPMDTRRFNYQAEALFLYDVKSWALSVMLEEMGLAAAERYVWTLRSRVVIANIPIYAVIKRNFDPVTFSPSSYVNGTLYTYTIVQTYANPDAWEPVEFTVDPLAPSITSVAAYSGTQGGTVDPNKGFLVNYQPGMFFSDLTRDDVGALRYMLRHNNYNVEDLPLNTAILPGSTGATGPISSGTEPWNPVSTGFFATNVLVTNITGVVGITNFIALRPGVEKVTFKRLNYDSLLGNTLVTITNRYTDFYVSNRVEFRQTVQRVQNRPDILFSAADLGVDAAGIPFVFARTIAFNDNNLINGDPNALINAGPGVIQAPIEITFSKVGPYFININGGSEETVDIIGFVWGSFDGSTNAPILYPTGTSIKDIERIVLGR
jgi:hypothetical protein